MHNWSPMTFLMYWLDPKDHILKILWHYLHFWLKYKHLKNQGFKQGYKQGYEQGYAQWVIHDILVVLCRTQGAYPESFAALSSFLKYQGYAQWVIHDILDVLCRPQGSYPKSFGWNISSATSIPRETVHTSVIRHFSWTYSGNTPYFHLKVW